MPDSNSAFKNLCINLYHMDWNAVGHAALDVAGIFFDGADVINAIWYACEGNMEMAAASAICAIPALGMATGNLLMKSNKLAAAGKAVKAIAKLTQGGMGVCAGISMAQAGFTNLLNGLEAGTFDAGAFLQTLGGIGIAALSGKGMVSSGRDLLACTGNAGKTLKGIPLDADISGLPIDTGEVRYRKGRIVVPMEVTYDMRLNPEEYAYAVVDKYGINLRGSGEQINIKFDPCHTKGPGVSRELDPTNIVLGPQAFISEEELARTISHELNHARSWLKGGRAPEHTARAAENALGDFINGGR